MFRIWLFVLTLLPAFGWAQVAPPCFNPNAACCARAGARMHAPEWVVCDQPTLDLGTLAEGTTATAQWVLMNVSDDTLRVSDVRSSCGCLVPWPTVVNRFIAPGDTLTIGARFNSAGKVGPQQKTVTVRLVLANPPTLNGADDCGIHEAGQLVGLALRGEVQGRPMPNPQSIDEQPLARKLPLLSFTSVREQPGPRRGGLPSFAFGIQNSSSDTVAVRNVWLTEPGSRLYRVLPVRVTVSPVSGQLFQLVPQGGVTPVSMLYRTQVCEVCMALFAGTVSDTACQTFTFTPMESFSTTDPQHSARARWDTTVVRVGLLPAETDTTVTVRLWNDGHELLRIRHAWLGSYTASLSDTVIRPGRCATLRVHIPAVPTGTRENHNPVFKFWLNDPTQPEHSVRLSWWRE